MTDKAIDAIQTVPQTKLNFHCFRSNFRADNGLKGALDYGHAIIDATDKLDQYLHTYGPMIESQWECIASRLETIRQPTACIDYGCGQGLAGLLVNDITKGRMFSIAREVVLIEPSAAALARSAAIYTRIAPTANVTPICKRFDDLRDGDISSMRSGETLHLFSNSLDVLGFDPAKLLKRTLQRGRHTILSVNHDREFNGGTPRIEGVKAAFEKSAIAAPITIRRSTLDRFTCNNPSQSKGVVWLSEFEVHDG
ncbi:hypothetical protein [Sphingomonas oryzagri]